MKSASQIGGYSFIVLDATTAIHTKIQTKNYVSVSSIKIVVSAVV